MSIDFAIMFATHDAFRRDVNRLAWAAAAGKADTPGVPAGWANFTRQLHVHHTVEDAALWPPSSANDSWPPCLARSRRIGLLRKRTADPEVAGATIPS